ncbi:hypothetical protein [Blautia marasmi]|uniref:hypothetical protein n=1 Tax=Blautia marasmi TaxID=1917868 RepID=UPI0025965ECD|nr:hypothetical protein [uncultured Blautia sp.]
MLTILSLGLLGIFYTGPYIGAVNAELYAVLKEERMKQYDGDHMAPADAAQKSS